MKVLIYVAVFAISFSVQFLVVRLFSLGMICMDNDTGKIHRFHDKPTTRAGGLGVFIAFIAGLLLLDYLSPGQEPFEGGRLSLLFALSTLPAFLAGFFEDLKANMDYKVRLAAIIFSSVVSIILLDVVISDLDVVTLPYLLAVPFTVFAVTGVTNSINIIDGFNGLASGFSLIALALFGIVAHICGDALVLAVDLVVVASVLGFFVWNYPGGRIFLGDGGAYFIGFMLALISIMLVTRNPEISTWFPVAILAYPIYEVLFSFYRKKIKRKGSAFVPDRVHFHMLIHKRISRNNPKTSCYLWGLVAFFGLLALIYYRHTGPLVLISVLFVLSYTYLYRKIVRFKARIPGQQSASPSHASTIKS